MTRNEVAQERLILTITSLMLIFLAASAIANYFNDRLGFSTLYLIMFLITLIHLFCYKKDVQKNLASEKILTILSIIFFSFFFLGKQISFDVFWILVLPMVAMILVNLKKLIFWVVTSNLILIVMILLSYTTNNIINYDIFALFSLQWAMIFMSAIAIYFKNTQEKLENEILNFEATQQKKIDEAVQEIQLLNKDIKATQNEIVERLGTLAEFRSTETGEHVRRVGLYSKELAKLYGLSDKESRLIERAAPLHDIGKVGIEDSILNKPAKLTNDEYERMKDHATIGEKILANSDKALIKMASEIAGGHHEKYDGTGYPRGLKENEIPISARIVAIADVFDALYSCRVYKDKWSIDEIINHFEEQKGKHFDPHLMALFLNNITSFKNIYQNNS